MNDSHDRQLIRRIGLGEDGALSELYRGHAQVLYNLAARLLQSPDRAGEAVSDLFLSVWRGDSGWSDANCPVGTTLISRMREMLISRTRPGARRHAMRDVDLWTIVSGPVPPAGGAGIPMPEDARRVGVARGVLEKCGAVSTTVLSLVYFGGYGIPEVARRLSITPAECRSRLHGCLEMLSGVKPGRKKGTSHDVRFSVCASGHSLGAITLEEEPEYYDHLAGGCPECMEEISRFSAAAHVLPMFLPNVKFPVDLSDKILFSLGLARTAGSLPHGPAAGAAQAPTVSDGIADEPPGPQPGPAAAGMILVRDRAGLLMNLAAIAVIAVLGLYLRTLHGKLDEQENLLESLDGSHTELVVKYNRLAGISGFFESRGVVTVLNGSLDYPGLSGRIVWDTADGSAMLQILNLPTELGRGNFRLKAVREDASVRIAEFRGDDRDTADVFYRFFPVEAGKPFMAEAFTVEASGEDGTGQGGYRTIMAGNIPGRQ